MNKSTDIKDHPSSYAVGTNNDPDEFQRFDYFTTYEDAKKRYDEVVSEFDNVYLLKLLECSET